MKNNHAGRMAVLVAGALGVSLVVRRQIRHTERLVWQKQRRPSLDVLACPICHGRLVIAPCQEEEAYHCPACLRDYPVVEGIPHFIQPAELTGWNRRFAGMYDWFSWVYRAFSAVAFAYIGISEEQARREFTDRLDPKGGRFLEVSIGPGVNLPYLVGRPDVGAIYGLDISLGQLKRCRDYVAHRGWDTQLQLGNAEQLPYLDNSFDGVLHIGGINFFSDKQRAIAEMIRVAKPGARIVICDENEKGAQAYERFLPGFKRAMGSNREAIVAPVALIPREMQEAQVVEGWNGWLYCIEFRKPHGGGTA
jgi:ubiquinone/menaquinone biosynthesis C-methylase UbiE/uncharacterized protein YbaR (Trm112 family)